MRRALLVLAVLACMAQTADVPPLTVRAGICTDAKDRDCAKKALIGFGPARVSVTYSVGLHKDNRALAFGLYCTEADYPSVWQLDGLQERQPQFIVSYPRVPPGECRAVAILHRADGSQRTARSELLILKARF